MLDDKIIDVARKLAMQNNPLLNIQSCNTISELSEYSNQETNHIHHNGKGHWVTSSTIGNRIILYHSMNLQPSDDILNEVTTLYSQDNKSVLPMEQCLFPQTGLTDCGLYAIPDAVDLVARSNPFDIFHN